MCVNIFSRDAVSAWHHFYLPAQQLFPEIFSRDSELLKACTFRFTPIQTQMFKEELNRRITLLNPQLMIDRGTGRRWRPAMINVFGF